MTTRFKLVLAALTASFALAGTVSTAGANRLSVSNVNKRIAWAPLTWTLEGAGSKSIGCPITLESSLHSRTISKVRGALIGYVNRGTAASGSCTGGSVTISQEALPVHLRYRSFSGTLPNITGISLDLIGLAIVIDNEGNICTAVTTAANPAVMILNVTGGVITGARMDESVTIPVTRGFICELLTLRLRGTGRVTLTGTNNAITVRLI